MTILTIIYLVILSWIGCVNSSKSSLGDPSESFHALNPEYAVDVAASGDEHKCSTTHGSCMRCTEYEISRKVSYCKSTGRKRLYLCAEEDKKESETQKASGENTEEGNENGTVVTPRQIWRSCPRTPEEEMVRVIQFQIILVIIAGSTYWALQNRKKLTMSAFDSRKSKNRNGQ